MTRRSENLILLVCGEEGSTFTLFVFPEAALSLLFIVSTSKEECLARIIGRSRHTRKL